MRRRMFGMFAAGAMILSACGGGGGSMATKPRPAVAVNLTVEIDNQRVSVSPASVGAGPVVFIVTNAADRTESLMVQSAGGSQTLASTGPINPQTTAQVKVDFNDPGDYTVGTGTSGNEATQATPASIQSATIHIGNPRQSGSNQLLLP
jgi:hypothetical protein